MANRGRKPSKERKGYFYEDQENAVVTNIQSTDQEEREEVFNNQLLPAFTKMISSIIRRYNLYQEDENFEETFDDTISFLMSKIEKFDAESGYKAYSYCGTICKNYLILRSNQRKKEQMRYARYDMIKNEINNNEKFSYDQHENKLEGLKGLFEKTSKEIHNMLENTEVYNLTEKEVKIGHALCDILENWEDMFAQLGSNKFNKSSILMYLKETTYLSTNEIRCSMKKYRAVYQDLRKKMIDDIYK